MAVDNLKPTDKVAIFLSNIPSDIASKILKNMDEKYIKEIVVSMYNLKDVSDDDTKKIIEEFYSKLLTTSESKKFNKESVKKLLENSIGEKKAMDIINEVYKENDFDFINNVPIKAIADFIKNENPQVIALVMNNLNIEQAVELASYLEPSIRKEAFKKFRNLKKMNPLVVAEISKNMKKFFSNAKMEVDNSAEMVADIISFMSKEEANRSLEDLKNDDPIFYEEVNKKLVTFEKIVELDDRLVQKILRAIDQRTLAYSLKGAPQNVSEKIYKNMTEEAAKAIMEDMETLPNLGEKAIEDSRRKFAKVMKKIMMESNNEQ